MFQSFNNLIYKYNYEFAIYNILNMVIIFENEYRDIVCYIKRKLPIYKFVDRKKSIS